MTIPQIRGPQIQRVLDFLQVETPPAWVAAASSNVALLLIDHANCEKKAASTALSLMYKYVDRTELLQSMSRLAREELRHFEQVLDLMATQKVAYIHLSAGRYAGQLHKLVRKDEPHRLVDLLILGAVVEARSCERFLRLSEVLDEPVAQLYRQLLNSEARHFNDYLNLAEALSAEDLSSRVRLFLDRDAELVTSADTDFRFHSGVPS